MRIAMLLLALMGALALSQGARADTLMLSHESAPRAALIDRYDRAPDGKGTFAARMAASDSTAHPVEVDWLAFVTFHPADVPLAQSTGRLARVAMLDGRVIEAATIEAFRRDPAGDFFIVRPPGALPGERVRNLMLSQVASVDFVNPGVYAPPTPVPAPVAAAPVAAPPVGGAPAPTPQDMIDYVVNGPAPGTTDPHAPVDAISAGVSAGPTPTEEELALAAEAEVELINDTNEARYYGMSVEDYRKFKKERERAEEEEMYGMSLSGQAAKKLMRGQYYESTFAKYLYYVGWIVYGAATMWLIGLMFQDGPGWALGGLVCCIGPFVQAFWAFAHFKEGRWPLFVKICGFVMMLAADVIG